VAARGGCHACHLAPELARSNCPKALNPTAPSRPQRRHGARPTVRARGVMKRVSELALGLPSPCEEGLVVGGCGGHAKPAARPRVLERRKRLETKNDRSLPRLQPTLKPLPHQRGGGLARPGRSGARQNVQLTCCSGRLIAGWRRVLAHIAVTTTPTSRGGRGSRIWGRHERQHRLGTFDASSWSRRRRRPHRVREVGTSGQGSGAAGSTR